MREARVALDFASVSDRVIRYAEIPLQQMLVSVARDNMQSAMPSWYDQFEVANRKSKDALRKTLAAYADNDMNVQKTAKALSIHPNTIYARMQRIEDITGKNALEYHALTELLLASEISGAQQ